MSRGPEARGGASRSEVIISDEDIDYPKAVNIDLLLALTQEACDKYWHDLKKDGLLIVDSKAVKKIPNGQFQTLVLPIINTASEKVGKALVANVVALGVITELSKVVTQKAIESAVMARVPKGTEELNLKALKTGFQLAHSIEQQGAVQ